MKEHLVSKYIVSGVAAVLMAIHLTGPKVEIDAATITLLVIALFPWLAHMVKKLELPGIGTVTLTDLRKAASKLPTEDVEETAKKGIRTRNRSGIRDWDSNLVLIDLGIQMEERLRSLADKHHINNLGSLSTLLRALREARVLNDDAANGLEQLIAARDRAAHGATVDRGARNWALKVGPRIVATLDSKIMTGAFCRVIACTGIGAAEENCDDVLPKHVWLVVPEPMHDDYPARLLACANQVCTNEPYGWKVDQTEPEVEDETTFHLLYEDWFKAIVWP